MKTKSKAVNVFCKQPTSVFHLSAKGTDVRGYEEEDGFVVLYGSQGFSGTVQSCSERLKEKRKDLIKRGILAIEMNCLILKDNYKFESPSTAASVLLGRHANGREEWVDEFGTSLKELQEERKIQLGTSLKELQDTSGANGKREGKVRFYCLQVYPAHHPDIVKMGITEKSVADRIKKFKSLAYEPKVLFDGLIDGCDEKFLIKALGKGHEQIGSETISVKGKIGEFTKKAKVLFEYLQ